MSKVAGGLPFYNSAIRLTPCGLLAGALMRVKSTAAGSTMLETGTWRFILRCSQETKDAHKRSIVSLITCGMPSSDDHCFSYRLRQRWVRTAVAVGQRKPVLGASEPEPFGMFLSRSSCCAAIIQTWIWFWFDLLKHASACRSKLRVRNVCSREGSQNSALQ